MLMDLSLIPFLLSAHSSQINDWLGSPSGYPTAWGFLLSRYPLLGSFTTRIYTAGKFYHQDTHSWGVLPSGYPQLEGFTIRIPAAGKFYPQDTHSWGFYQSGYPQLEGFTFRITTAGEDTQRLPSLQWTLLEVNAAWRKYLWTPLGA